MFIFNKERMILGWTGMQKREMCVNDTQLYDQSKNLTSYASKTSKFWLFQSILIQAVISVSIPFALW